MMHIYFSYSRQDFQEIKFLSEELVRNYSSRIEINTDYSDFGVAGEDFAKQMTIAISTADAIVCFQSKSYLNSTWSQKEQNLIKNISKAPIIYCQIEGLNIEDSYLQLSHDIEALLNKKQNANSIDCCPSIAHKKSKDSPRKIGKNTKKWLWLSAIIIILVGGTICFVCGFDNTHSSIPMSQKYQHNSGGGLRGAPIQFISTNTYYQSIQIFIIVCLFEAIIFVILLIKQKKRLRIRMEPRADISIPNDKIEIPNADHAEIEIRKKQNDINIRFSPTIIRFFIAGSTALREERDGLRATMSIMCNKWKSKHLEIESYTYEDFDQTMVSGGRQNEYNTFIRNNADYSILIVKDSIGKVSLEEINESINSFLLDGHPEIMVYFLEKESYSADEISLMERIQEIQQYWGTYKDVDNLKLKFSNEMFWNIFRRYENNLGASGNV